MQGLARRREKLEAEVARLFRLHEGKYGSPRITADLKEAGWRVSENTVAALMAGQHLAARRKKKRKATTRPGRGRWRAPDLIKRDFPPSRSTGSGSGMAPSSPPGEGRLHLVSVLDVASRRVLGFTLGERHDAQLAYGALAMALAVCGGQAPEVIFHTDCDDSLNPRSTPPGHSGRRAAGSASSSRWAGWVLVCTGYSPAVTSCRSAAPG